MASSVTYSYRDSFTGTGGTFFGGRAVYAANLPFTSGANMSDEISAVMHYTAPVGTSYEQIYDSRGSGGDEFGASAQDDIVIIINRSATDTLTLRFTGTSKNCYVVIPAGKHFICRAPGIVITALGALDLAANISAKFTSGTDTVEVLTVSINAAFS